MDFIRKWFSLSTDYNEKQIEQRLFQRVDQFLAQEHRFQYLHQFLSSLRTEVINDLPMHSRGRSYEKILKYITLNGALRKFEHSSNRNLENSYSGRINRHAFTDLVSRASNMSVETFIEVLNRCQKVKLKLSM